MKKYHYVYKIINHQTFDSRKFYIGVRTCVDCIPEEDTNYMSSSKHLKKIIKEIGREHFSKEILSIWETRKDAVNEEIRLHNFYDVGRNAEFYNRAKQTSLGFDTAGTTHTVKEETGIKISAANTGFVNMMNKYTGKISRVSLEEAYSNHDLITVNKKMVVVFDKSINQNRHVTVEEFKSDENLIHINKGKVTVMDLEDNVMKSVSCEEYKLFKNVRYVMATTKKRPGVGKGLVTVKNILTGKGMKIPASEINPEIHVGPNSKIVEIYNTENVLMFTCYGNFDNFCIKNNLPCKQLTKSFKNKGTPIMSDLNNRTITLYTKRNQLMYKGWYAISKKPNN